MAKRLGLDWRYAHPREVFDEMRAGDAVDRRHHLGSPRARAARSPIRASRKAIRATRVVFTEDFPDGDAAGRGSSRAKVIPAAEQPDSEYPFVLITGRQLEHWHTGSMTRRTEVLDAIEPHPVASLHSLDLAALGVAPGGMITVASRRGQHLASRARRRRHAARRGVHPVLLLRGGGEPAHESGARSVRQDSGVQVLRGQRDARAAPRARRAATPGTEVHVDAPA